ncbi:helix-turn-helix domain-containing protein [Paraburkholderia phymatum]|uniref:helix-turn-helix domain-containing protein n=1 Tax=Paraburkholderia phymatum TaxID=148447 RepID=UPI00317A953B
MNKFEKTSLAEMSEDLGSLRNASSVVPIRMSAHAGATPVRSDIARQLHLIDRVAAKQVPVFTSKGAHGLRLLLQPLTFDLLASVAGHGPPPYELIATGWVYMDGDVEPACSQAIEIHFRFKDPGARMHRDSPEEGLGIDEKIHASATWLKSNLENVITVSDAARTVAMSERNFLRRFRQQLGVTPSEYLLCARLEKTCQLLIESQLPVDKIARRCGMTCGTRLAKIFRKRFGMPPTEYRLRYGTRSYARPDA